MSARKEVTMTNATGSRSAPTTWGSDFFGTLNELPPEPVGLIAGVLEAMRTEPAFQAARRAVLADLCLGAGARVLDAGCGTGAALPDLLDMAGPEVEVVGVDPTEAFLARARERANGLGAKARYEPADVRALPHPDRSFDAAFCDKVLLHVGPAGAVLSELVRVTRPGGRIGAVEWVPAFALATGRPELAAALNDALRGAVYDFMVGPNLARHFRAAGLREVRTGVHLAHARSLADHPFWRTFLLDQLPLFVHAGLVGEEQAKALTSDLEELDQEGVFAASCVIWTAVGTRG
jgi:ubiquinone/menaquinone biosynthesis C-methylase UbiE